MGKPVNKLKWTVRQDANDETKHALMEGWRKEGHTKFKQLHEQVTIDRATRGGKDFENDFMRRQKEECAATKSGRKRKATNAEDLIPVDSCQVDLLGELIGTVTQEARI